MSDNNERIDEMAMGETERLIEEVLRLDADATKGPWATFNVDDPSFMNAHGVASDAPETHDLFRGDDPDYGDIDPNRTVCLTLLQDPRAACHRSWKWDENAELIASYRSFAPRLARMLKVAMDDLRRIKSGNLNAEQCIASMALAEIEKIAKEA